MYQYKKHFTVDEAKTYLPRLKFEVNQIIQLKIKLDAVGYDVYLRKYRPGYNPDTLNEFPDEFLQLMDIIQALQDDGIQIKGIEQDLVDFPALRKIDEEVFLCWKIDEDDIKYWHSLNGGFRGRRPIEDF